MEAEVQEKLNQSSELLAALLSSPAFARKLPPLRMAAKPSDGSSDPPAGGSDAQVLPVEEGGLSSPDVDSVAQLLISKRALAAQVSGG